MTSSTPAIPDSAPPPTIETEPPPAEPVAPEEPDHGEAPPEAPATDADRLWPNLVWDGVLVVVTLVTVAVLLLFGAPSTLPLSDVTELAGLAAAFTPVLFLATALAVSVRAGAPNLAVLAAMPLGWLLFTRGMEYGSAAAWAAAIVGMVVLAAVVTAVVLLTRVPAWLATLALVAVVGVFGDIDYDLANPGGVGVRFADDLGTLWILVGASALVSILACAVMLIPTVRRGSARNVRALDGSERGVAGAAAMFAGLALSMVLAGTAGVVSMIRPDGVEAFPFAADGELFTLVILAGVVLLSGTTLSGRGGLVGVVLASCLAFLGLAGALGAGEAVTDVVTPAQLLLGGLLVAALISHAVAGRLGARHVPAGWQTAAPAAAAGLTVVPLAHDASMEPVDTSDHAQTLPADPYWGTDENTPVPVLDLPEPEPEPIPHPVQPAETGVMAVETPHGEASEAAAPEASAVTGDAPPPYPVDGPMPPETPSPEPVEPAPTTDADSPVSPSSSDDPYQYRPPAQ